MGNHDSIKSPPAFIGLYTDSNQWKTLVFTMCPPWCTLETSLNERATMHISVRQLGGAQPVAVVVNDYCNHADNELRLEENEYYEANELRSVSQVSILLCKHCDAWQYLGDEVWHEA